MSLSDITLDSKVFSLSSVNGKQVIRRASAASTPANIKNLIMEIAHTPGSGSKPDRHLIKFSLEKYDTTLLQWFPWSIHMVLTVPKGPGLDEVEDVYLETGDLLGICMYSLFGIAGTVARIGSGEYS